MGGAISRSEAILRLHIPWVRTVIQAKALALATRAGWFGGWIFAEDSCQHESCDHGHAPPAKGSVGQRGDKKNQDPPERPSSAQQDKPSPKQRRTTTGCYTPRVGHGLTAHSKPI